jgi:hypothetical protein
MRRLLDSYVKDVQARFEAAGQAHPDGVIVLARAVVLEAEYEPLFLSASNEIGLRVHLAVRFEAEGDYAVRPTFFSQYENPDWRLRGPDTALTVNTIGCLGRPAIWDAVQDSAVPVKYHVSISSLDFVAETKELPQRTYLESFRHEGSSDCGPTPTNHF